MQMPHMPKGLTRALGALLAALALYSLLGFFILPGIGLRIANQQLAQYATVPAHLQRIELNPFSLELTAWGLQIGEPGITQVFKFIAAISPSIYGDDQLAPAAHQFINTQVSGVINLRSAGVKVSIS